MIRRWLTISKSGKKKKAANDTITEEVEKTDFKPVNYDLNDETCNSTSSDNPSSTALVSNLDIKENFLNEDNYLQLSSPLECNSEMCNHDNGNYSQDDIFNMSITIPTSTSGGTPMQGIEPTILTTKVSELMPYGDGSNKVFGYENFGNTCYCNSVLQCLYNLSSLRENILQFPEKPRGSSGTRKYEMKGNRPRIFTEASFERNSVNTNNHISNYKSQSVDEGKPTPINSINSNATTPSEKKNKFFKGFGPKHIQDNNKNEGSPVLPTVPKIIPVSQDAPPLIVETPNEPGIPSRLSSENVTERPPDAPRKIIVGRALNYENPLPESSNGTNLDLRGESNSSLLSPLDKRDTRRSSSSSQVSPEYRKKSALIHGPVVNIDYSLNGNDKATLYSSLKDIFECITENTYLTGVISPSSFVDVLKRENVLFDTTMHQDAHEFFNFLLNELSEYIERENQKMVASDINNDGALGKTTNFISNLFQGTLTNQIKCLTCDNITSRDEPFLDFPIEVQGDEETDIQAILKSYHQREMLNGSNKFYCDECCGLQEAERLVGLKQLPDTLALHLKRFKYSEKQNCNIKLFNNIHYPLTLSVCSSINAEVCQKYELAGIVVHMGGGPQHGHYVSLCKHKKFGWLLFDDETVETVKEDTVLEFTGESPNMATAYVLFYKAMYPNAVFENGRENIAKEQEENMDNLIKYDDWLRACQNNQKKKEEVLVPEEVDTAIDDSFASNTPLKPRRKSRMFSFRKS
ncbi:ubp13p [Saccharomyces arboricola H-6]|uniref:Ubiquitin carboxyl-terminal hydrolase n=1 Tax=Saccharomyces arboricola (strain H-6 / AS 2.3317 / CBS 10644) TaxID=1160507 RepID=J8QAN3_SACAR|nr:ubp13p [Saccharomyces arboricola H-6]